MLGHRLRRWPNIKPALVQRVVFAGSSFRRSVSPRINSWRTGWCHWLSGFLSLLALLSPPSRLFPLSSVIPPLLHVSSLRPLGSFTPTLPPAPTYFPDLLPLLSLVPGSVSITTHNHVTPWRRQQSLATSHSLCARSQYNNIDNLGFVYKMPRYTLWKNSHVGLLF